MYLVQLGGFELGRFGWSRWSLYTDPKLRFCNSWGNPMMVNILVMRLLWASLSL